MHSSTILFASVIFSALVASSPISKQEDSDLVIHPGPKLWEEIQRSATLGLDSEKEKWTSPHKNGSNPHGKDHLEKSKPYYKRATPTTTTSVSAAASNSSSSSTTPSATPTAAPTDSADDDSDADITYLYGDPNAATDDAVWVDDDGDSSPTDKREAEAKLKHKDSKTGRRAAGDEADAEDDIVYLYNDPNAAVDDSGAAPGAQDTDAGN